MNLKGSGTDSHIRGRGQKDVPGGVHRASNEGAQGNLPRDPLARGSFLKTAQHSNRDSMEKLVAS